MSLKRIVRSYTPTTKALDTVEEQAKAIQEVYDQVREFYDYLDSPEFNASLKGEKGDKGEQGPQGIQGETGPQGPQGPHGPAGYNGVSVVSITKTSSNGLVDTYTITYSNGTSRPQYTIKDFIFQTTSSNGTLIYKNYPYKTYYNYIFLQYNLLQMDHNLHLLFYLLLQ